MRLNGQQFFMLAIPFIIGSIVYVFNDDIVKNIHFLFPEYHEEHSLSTLNKKAAIYLDIESKGSFYHELEDKISARRSNATWIANTILYKKYKNVKKEEPQKHAWRLQMVYPKKKIVIINGKVTRINEMVDGARVVDIKSLRVLLKHNERLEWVTLFQ